MRLYRDGFTNRFKQIPLQAGLISGIVALQGGSLGREAVATFW
jgi:hypothetical protein